jgi:glyoxylate/hydroxypyruvate reductase A
MLGGADVTLRKFNPKILVYSPQEAEEYAEMIRGHGYTAVTAASTPDEAEQHLPGTEILLCWQFPTYLFATQAAQSVRWIQSMGAGVDDLVSAAALPRHVVLTRIVGQFGAAIAEYVFAYLLFLAKDITRSREAQKRHNWDPFIAQLLSEETIGVAGLGSIGGEIVRKARAFDMAVHGLSLSGKQADLVDRIYRPSEWEKFASEVDYLVLTLPLTATTRRVVDKKVLSAMKPGACLVNVGRGQLVAEDDLIEILHTDHLRAAVLDVFEREPLPPDNPLWSMPNVFVTPHSSGPSTPKGVTRFFIDNLARFCEGKALEGAVNRERGY